MTKKNFTAFSRFAFHEIIPDRFTHAITIKNRTIFFFHEILVTLSSPNNQAKIYIKIYCNG